MSQVEHPRAYVLTLPPSSAPRSIEEAGKPVHIRDVKAEDRATHTYFCIGCGDRMEAVLRGKTPHFRHSGDRSCAYGPETELHHAAKQLIAKALADATVGMGGFEISRKSTQKCRDHSIRKWCNWWTSTKQDLLLSVSRIRSIQVERDVVLLARHRERSEGQADASRYRPDILVELDDGTQIFIEVLVTSECSISKVASGAPIIEVPFTNERQLRAFDNRLRDAENATFMNFDEVLPQYFVHPTKCICAENEDRAKARAAEKRAGRVS